MADRAIGSVDALARFHCFGILGQFFDRCLGIACIQFAVLGVVVRAFSFVLTDLRPAEQALEGTQAGVEGQVDQAEYQRDYEHVKPPAWQRVVELLEVLIPDVTGRLDLTFNFLDVVAEDQPEASEDTQQGYDCDKPADNWMCEI